jgi:zinc/manganese transport system ATP-binding protein
VNGTDAPALLSARDAAVRIGARTIWSGVDLDIGAGEFVAVLGPNGAGKSTLLKAVLGLIPLAAGEITVSGMPPGRAGHEIGYLPQRRSFDSSVRIRGVDIVRLGLDGQRLGVPAPAAWSRRGRDAARRVREVIELVGATPFADRPIGRLSGGEQQRLLIAQALVRRPPLLLLDEPLDSLDLPNQDAIADLLERIAHQQGVTVMIVAHDVNPLLRAIDQVVYVASGRAVAGPPDDVITTESLTALYGAPVEVLRTAEGTPVVVGQSEAASHHPALHAPHERHLHG